MFSTPLCAPELTDCHIAIQAPIHPPPVHPRDRALLTSLASLGKPKVDQAGVSFLRRTEYISNAAGKNRFESTTSRGLIANTQARPSRRVPVSASKENPQFIKEQVEQSFKTANVMLKDRNRVRHPSKKHLELVDSYPLIPDLSAFSDVGGYVVIKFVANPVPPSSTYDKRLESGLLRPVALSPDEEAAQRAKMAAHDLDPEHVPMPETPGNYEFYLVEKAEHVKNLKRRFDVHDPERDNDELYPESSGFPYKRIRAYETEKASGGGADRKYDEEVAIAVNDGKDGAHQKAAYYYPVLQRLTIKPQRNKNIARHKLAPGSQPWEEEETVDVLHVEIQSPTEKEKLLRGQYTKDPYGDPKVEEQLAAEADAEEARKNAEEARSNAEVDMDDGENEEPRNGAGDSDGDVDGNSGVNGHHDEEEDE